MPVAAESLATSREGGPIGLIQGSATENSRKRMTTYLIGGSSHH